MSPHDLTHLLADLGDLPTKYFEYGETDKYTSIFGVNDSLTVVCEGGIRYTGNRIIFPSNLWNIDIDVPGRRSFTNITLVKDFLKDNKFVTIPASSIIAIECSSTITNDWDLAEKWIKKANQAPKSKATATAKGKSKTTTESKPKTNDNTLIEVEPNNDDGSPILEATGPFCL